MLKTLACAIFVLTFLLSGVAFACSCSEESQAQTFRDADAVFRGTVKTIRHKREIAHQDLVTGRITFVPPATHDDQVVTFLVTAVWKGQVPSLVNVLVTAHPGMCDGYVFALDREYVVYATEQPLNEAGLRLAQKLGLPHPILSTVIVDRCPLRVRLDVGVESGLLGKSKAPVHAQ